ncbi:MAG TPA: hypothetical protein VKG63_07405 [Steroidobacteraceae bacterium]|nr:hypothetical protein [Steroidobacteraceae bacterium]
MLKALSLTVMIGPAVLIPAPKVVIDSLTGVQVTNGKQGSGFQLTFAVSKTSPLLQIMLPAGYFDPIVTRVAIIATVGGIPNVLMDGFVTRQEITPSNEPGQSTLTITGEDLSVAMGLVQKTVPYPAMGLTVQVYALLAPYALLGIVPIVIPPFITSVSDPTEQWDTQSLQTDLDYIRSLASSVGYTFYVDPGPIPGQSTAYFGPDIHLPVPQPALSIDMDAMTNVESLSFSLDGMAKKITLFTIMDPETGRIPIPIPVPNLNLFKPPLGARPTPPARIEYYNGGAALQPDQAASAILGALMNNSDAISGTGTLDVLRYGQVLRPRMLVGVRGASVGYDGLYYVDSVTHSIKRGEYKQNFSLSRDGLISNTPVVMP